MFGEIPGAPVGSIFSGRKELAKSGIHPPTMHGMSGSQYEGCTSIVLSGGYEDDVDEGDHIIYTGHGGNDPTTAKQIKDQSWTLQNKALSLNCVEGLPVRVTRGSNLDSPYAPDSGFRYDGLYRVERFWMERGRAGFQICRFELFRDDPSSPTWEPTSPPSPKSTEPAARRTATVQRVVRNTKKSLKVKELHEHTCQICGVQLMTLAGPYSEGAHIRPLGRPHDGADETDNILCLCPNCHIQLDYGAIVIEDDFTIVNLATEKKAERSLKTVRRHTVHLDNVRYHRKLWRSNRTP